MKLTTFTSLSVLVASLSTPCVADLLGTNQLFVRSHAGEISASRRHLGNLIEILSGDAGNYASPRKCMQGELVETVSANTGRSTWDAPARITVQGQMVFVTFSHGSPFKKEIELTHETMVASPASDCLGSAYLKKITIAPNYYLSLVLPFKQAAGDVVSLASRQQALRDALAADPATATVRLKDFGDPQYIENLKHAIHSHQQAAGLVADGWFSSVDYGGPSEMISLRDNCRSAFDPGNPENESCVALSDMSSSVDALFSEADAALYHEESLDTPVLQSSKTLEGFMSSTVAQP